MANRVAPMKPKSNGRVDGLAGKFPESSGESMIDDR